MIKPPDFDPSETLSGTVLCLRRAVGSNGARFAGAANRSMWHLMLAQQGYIVMSVDNRGTPAPRGRAWRKCIYRKIGHRQFSATKPQPFERSAKWPFVDSSAHRHLGLERRRLVDPERDVPLSGCVQRGMSVAPVPDIRYYDTIYQERYCGLPQDHPDEYKQSSPITFAAQLKGNCWSCTARATTTFTIRAPKR